MARYTANTEATLRAKGYVPAKRVAERLKCSYSTVFRWAKAGKVSVVKVGGSTFVDWNSVLRTLNPKVAVALGLTSAEPPPGASLAPVPSAATLPPEGAFALVYLTADQLREVTDGRLSVQLTATVVAPRKDLE